MQNISKGRLDVLRDWLRGVDQITGLGKASRPMRWYTCGFILERADAIDRETITLFGGWEARRQVAVYSLIGAYQRPSRLVSALLDVFERTQKVVGLAHFRFRDEQKLNRLIGWQRKLRLRLDTAYGTALAPSDAPWLLGSAGSDSEGHVQCLSHYLLAGRAESADEKSKHERA